MSVKATAIPLGIGWELVKQAATDACRELVYNNPNHLDGVRALRVDEHVWKHPKRPGQPSYFVTMLVDLTPVIDGVGPARSIDITQGRSPDVLRRWLRARDEALRARVEVVTMDGFTGYATAVDEILPQARKVMDPFHVVHLPTEKLTTCRQRLQRELTGRRGVRNDPHYKSRKTLLTRTGCLTERQKQRLEVLWACDENHVSLQVTWLVYQDLIQAYAHPNKKEGKNLMVRLMNTLRSGVPKSLKELAQLGRTLWRRRIDILAYFDVGRPMVRRKRSTAGWSIYVESPWGSGTLITTSCGH